MSPETQDPFPADATYTEKTFFFGPRDVVLSALKVHFRAQAEPAEWHQVIAKLNCEVFAQGKTSRAGFIALPERVEQYCPFLAAKVTLDEDELGMAAWDFAWSRAENDSPPEVMVKSSQAVGGFPNVLNQLGAVWPATSPVEAQISASYFVFNEDWRFTLVPPKVKRVAAEERVHEVRPTRWTVNPPSGCVSEITQQLSPDPKMGYILRGQGVYTLRLTPRFLNEVDYAIWSGLKIFLKARRSPPKR